jgi:histidyl-tRNA synthetase
VVSLLRESTSTQPPSGFRDFLPKEARLRTQLIQKISSVYESFGFSPLDTPAVENLSVLQSSGGGEENEKLIFKILKRGDKFKNSLASAKEEDDVADLGLRFDLTVPLARVVANYRSEIRFPWKVFHIASVWRAERAQKGRFREFTQCDVDILGSKSQAAECEVIQAVSWAVAKAGAENLELCINDRRLLIALASHFGFTGQAADKFSIVLDKKDKISADAVTEELEKLSGKKLSDEAIELIAGNFTLERAKKIAAEPAGQLEQLIASLKALELPLSKITFDPSLARGLSYYTGPVFELRHSSAGYSLGGGGRYDQLVGRFSKEEIPACGFSIGFDRLLILLAEKLQQVDRPLLFIPVLDEKLRTQISLLASDLRKAGIACDLYADSAKLKNQMKYASDSGFRWVLIIGEEEWNSKTFKVKDFRSGSETNVRAAELNSHVRNLLSGAE